MKRIVLVLAVVLGGLHTSAQSPATGFPMYGSFDSQGIAGVNLQNLNYHLGIPITGSPGRKLSLNFGLSYDSSIWTIASGTWTPRTDQRGFSYWGWDNNNVTGRLLFSSSTAHCAGDPHGLNLGATLYHNFAFITPDGTSHPFNVSYQVAGDDCGTSSGVTTGYATDDSGYFMDGSVMNVWDRAGVRASNQSLEDTNGNELVGTVNSQNVSETDWTDSVGRVGLKITSTGTVPTDFQYLDSSGAYQDISIENVSWNIKTSFGCPGIVEFTGTASLPIYIFTPIGKYTINYEPTPGATGYYTGRIKQILLPTGGSVSFTYTGSNGGINCADASTNGLQIVANDGTNASTKAFTRVPSGANWQTTITNPQLPYDSAANQTVVTFNAAGQETARQIYQGSAIPQNLLRAGNTSWAANGTPSSKSMVLEDGQTQVTTDSTYDTYGNLLTLTEHDFGHGAAGTIYRTTTFTYSTDNNYLNRHIVNIVTDHTTADTGGAIRARERVTYDGSAPSPCPTGIPGHDDTNYGCSFLSRGNPTSVTSYTNAAGPSGPIVKNFHYDVFGNLVQADLDCCQSKDWTYSAATQYAYPDSVTIGATGATRLTIKQTYNLSSGTVATVTDENGNATSYTYDDVNRVLTEVRPDSKTVTYSYDDAGKTVTVSAPIQSGTVLQMKSYTDGLGRTIKRALLDGSNISYSVAETQYDPLNRPYKVSNPHNSVAGYWTETHYDALGRPTALIPPDGTASSNNLKYSYAANSVTLTDQAGKARKQQLDGFGRIVKSFEPDITNGNLLTQETDMTYSVLDGLTSVTQGAQSRTYTYDDLGRLLSIKTPESNQVPVSYVYNNFDLPTQRTDARGVVTTYSYDNLNRTTQVSYNVGTSGVTATPSVTFTYDEMGATAHALGQLTTMTDGIGSEKYTYNSLEQLTQLTKTIGSTSYTTNYTYNFAGSLSSVGYPSGFQVQESYDPIGRLCSVGPVASSCTSPTNYVSGFAYNPASQITSFTYGNGVVANMAYSGDRLQLTSLSYIHGTQTLFNVSYWYKTDATNCPGAPAGNNGQIQCISDGIDSGRNENVGYDALARLVSAATTGSTSSPRWALSFAYDRYGNRTAQNVTAGMAPANSVAVSTATNRITTTGYGYDLNGNLINDGSNSLTYDAENRLLTTTGSLGSGSYAYDGNGLRVKKISGGTTTVYIFSGSNVIAEYLNGAGAASPTRQYVFAGDAQLAKIEGGVTTYYHQDHQSNRLVTNSSGTPTEQLGTFPFGESWYNTAGEKWLFTKYERDAENANDYAGARGYVNRLGRFGSVDAFGGAIAVPQSLNRFSYVQNDPINSTDPSGRLIIPGFGYVSLGGGFGSNWDEFDLLWRQVGSADIYHSDDPKFNFEEKQAEGELANNVEIDHLYHIEIYGSTLMSVDWENALNRAKAIVIKILSGNNECSKFFNSSAAIQFAALASNGPLGGLFPTTAADFFQTTRFGGADFGPTGTAARTNSSTALNATVLINSNPGGAFLTVGWLNGDYPSGSLGNQSLVLLHEFAHNVLQIPPDSVAATGSEGASARKSGENTNTVFSKCKKALKAALKGN